MKDFSTSNLSKQLNPLFERYKEIVRLHEKRESVVTELKSLVLAISTVHTSLSAESSARTVSHESREEQEKVSESNSDSDTESAIDDFNLTLGVIEEAIDYFNISLESSPALAEALTEEGSLLTRLEGILNSLNNLNNYFESNAAEETSSSDDSLCDSEDGDDMDEWDVSHPNSIPNREIQIEVQHEETQVGLLYTILEDNEEQSVEAMEQTDINFPPENSTISGLYPEVSPLIINIPTLPSNFEDSF